MASTALSLGATESYHDLIFTVIPYALKTHKTRWPERIANVAVDILECWRALTRTYLGGETNKIDLAGD